ncbi:hypothetical protein AB833_29050 [Chromatiales bacterium (ex Bugula neritina AB1)]|nr:hypothetical protein AB833_29050 [Chromatiales bacterium (ex Bugula neritina AB1)]
MWLAKSVADCFCISYFPWCREQRSRTDAKGNYLLEVPYVESNELILDVLRHGPDIEVLRPTGLRRKVKEQVEKMAAIYR